MQKLPNILAAHFCADCVADIPYDIRASAFDSWSQILAFPHCFPNADFAKVRAMHEATKTLDWFAP